MHAGSIALQSHHHALTLDGLLAKLYGLLLPGPESVQTPREVYDELKKEGYRVQYYRLPLTDGEAPKEGIFDVFYSHVKDVPPSDALIFNCQMGGGRTTTGMVIGCLIRMHTSGHSPTGTPPTPVVFHQAGVLVEKRKKSMPFGDHIGRSRHKQKQPDDAAVLWPD